MVRKPHASSAELGLLGRRGRKDQKGNKQKKFWLLQQLRVSGSAESLKHLQIAQIVHSLAELQRSGLLTSTQDYAHAIRALGVVGWWRDALAVLRSQTEGQSGLKPKEDTPMYNAAIVALDAAPLRWVRSLALWTQCFPDISTANSVATALKGALLWEHAFSMLKRSEDRGIKMDTVSQNILITASAAIGCTWRRILSQMAHFEHDIISVNSGLSTLGSKSGWGECLVLLEGSPSRRVVLDQMAASSGIIATQDLGHWPTTFTLLFNKRTTPEPEVDSEFRTRAFNSAIATAQKWAAWSQAAQLFESLQMRGKPSLVSLNSLLSTRDLQSWRWEAAVQAFDSMWQGCNSEPTPDLFTLASLAAILEGFARWEQALFLVQAHGIAGLDVSKSDNGSSTPMLQATVGAAESASCWERSLDLLWWTKAFGIESLAASAASAATAMSEGKQWQRALGCSCLPTPAASLVASNSAITALARGGEWPLALSAFQSLGLAKLEADAFTWTSAISACEKPFPAPAKFGPKSEHGAMELKEILRQRKVTQSEVADKLANILPQWKARPKKATAFLGTLARQKHPELARLVQSVLLVMRDSCIQVNVYHYGAAMAAYERLGNWQGALDLLCSMHANDVSPDLVTCNTAISACSKGEQWQLALYLLQDLVAVRVADCVSYNSAVSACCAGSEWKKVFQILQLMAFNSILPDSITFNGAMAACSKVGRWQFSIHFLDAMPAGRPDPSAFSYGTAIDSCCHTALWDTALLILEKVGEVKLKTNAVMFGAAVSACDKAQKWQESLLLLDNMAQHKLVPDSIAATAALSSCAGAGQWELALDFFRQLYLWEMTIDEVMYSCCIKACAKGAQAERSFQLLLTMLDCNVMPNEICYTASEDPDTVDLTVDFAGLTISVRGSPSSSAAFVRGLSSHPLATSPARPSSAGPRPSSAYQASPARSQVGSTTSVDTRASIQDSFERLPQSWASLATAQLGVPAADALARAERAWKAGCWAKAVLEGRVSSPNRTPTIPQQNRAWCVLRSARLAAPQVFTTSGAFHNAVGPLEGSSTLCHAFPSQTEARIYFSAAGLEYPA
eukprot:s552_g15.t2